MIKIWGFATITVEMQRATAKSAPTTSSQLMLFTPPTPPQPPTNLSPKEAGLLKGQFIVPTNLLKKRQGY
jgi:hypothetical protein